MMGESDLSWEELNRDKQLLRFSQEVAERTKDPNCGTSECLQKRILRIARYANDGVKSYREWCQARISPQSEILKDCHRHASIAQQFADIVRHPITFYKLLSLRYPAAGTNTSAIAAEINADLDAALRICADLQTIAEQVQTEQAKGGPSHKMQTSQKRADRALALCALWNWEFALDATAFNKDGSITVSKPLVSLLANLRKLAGAKDVGDDQLEKTLRSLFNETPPARSEAQ